jgi:hypothetical protein
VRVVSKSLTADVRLTRVAWTGSKLLVEGMVKEIMPMTVELAPADLARMARLLAAPLATRVAERLPAALRGALGRYGLVPPGLVNAAPATPDIRDAHVAPTR